MKRCNCGAISRINYPFGRRSGGVIGFLIKHDSECRYHISNKKIPKMIKIFQSILKPKKRIVKSARLPK